MISYNYLVVFFFTLSETSVFQLSAEPFLNCFWWESDSGDVSSLLSSPAGFRSNCCSDREWSGNRGFRSRPVNPKSDCCWSPTRWGVGSELSSLAIFPTGYREGRGLSIRLNVGRTRLENWKILIGLPTC